MPPSNTTLLTLSNSYIDPIRSNSPPPKFRKLKLIYYIVLSSGWGSSGTWPGWIPRKTTIVSSLPHYVHHLTGGDPPVVQEPLGWERLGKTYTLTVTEFRSPHGMEEGKGERYLAPGRQYDNALLGVCHQEEEEALLMMWPFCLCGCKHGRANCCWGDH